MGDIFENTIANIYCLTRDFYISIKENKTMAYFRENFGYLVKACDLYENKTPSLEHVISEDGKLQEARDFL